MRIVKEIEKNDVGKVFWIKVICPCCGNVKMKENTQNLLGVVQSCDIGKRIYYNETQKTFHVENIEQYKRRIKA